MSNRSRSPRRYAAPSLHAEVKDERTGKEYKREKSTNEMQQIFIVVKKLRDEKSSLETHLGMLSEKTEAEEKRLIRELCKSRVDLENLSELYQCAADGIDTKSTVNIPELPEAAVAKVVPKGLRPLLEVDYGDHDRQGATMMEEIGSAKRALSDSIQNYECMAEAGKGLVWDVERLNAIIKAYETDLVALRETGSEQKADINQLRLKWRKKFSACRRWQDFTRRSHVLKFQEQLDDIQDAFDEEREKTEAEIKSIMEMIGTMRARDNRAKLTLFLKKMKNAAMYKVWRGWMVYHQMIQQEKFGAELDVANMSAAEKLAAMKSKEREAMLRCFLKRWQNRKIAVPFMTWADIVIELRQQRALEEMERQRLALLQKMQALEGSAVAQKLKLIFARLTGKMKDLTFRALVKNMQMGRIARLGEDEKFKRLKVFLEAKLKGIKYSTFKCLEREARSLKAARIKGNSMAQRVAAFLEMKVKGLKYAQFSAFKRFAKDGSRERAEEDRLADLVAARDSASLQRLKIFLQGKEARLKFAFFSFWVQAMAGSTESRMQALLAEKRRKRAELEAYLRDMERKLGGVSGGADIESQIADVDAELAALNKRRNALKDKIAAAQLKKQQLEDELDAEMKRRRDDKAAEKDLAQLIEDAKADKDGLQAELDLIVGQIGELLHTTKK